MREAQLLPFSEEGAHFAPLRSSVDVTRGASLVGMLAISEEGHTASSTLTGDSGGVALAAACAASSVEIAGALVSPLISAPRPEDFRRGRVVPAEGDFRLEERLRCRCATASEDRSRVCERAILAFEAMHGSTVGMKRDNSEESARVRRWLHTGGSARTRQRQWAVPSNVEWINRRAGIGSMCRSKAVKVN